METTARRSINIMRVKHNDKSYGIWVIMTASRKICREDMIPRRSREGVKKSRRGGGNVAAMGRGCEGTDDRRGGVGDDGNIRWQWETVKRNEEERQRKNHKGERRCEGKNVFLATAVKAQGDRVAEAITELKIKQGRHKDRTHTTKRKRRMATMRRTRKELIEVSRGGKGLGKKRKKVEMWEAMEQYQIGMDATEDEEEMYNSEQDEPERTRKDGPEEERPPKVKFLEERKYEVRRGRGRRAGGDLGSTSSMKDQGDRIREDNRGRTGRGRTRGSRGRGRQPGQWENREQNPVGKRRYRNFLKKRVQYAKRAYSKNTDEDIRRIIQRMEEEATQGQSDSKMEDWEYLLLDLRNTRGCMTLYK